MITAFKAAPFLAELMIDLSADEKIVEQACKLLLALGDNEELRASLLSAEAVTALATAYDGSHKNQNIKLVAKQALNRLTSA